MGLFLKSLCFNRRSPPTTGRPPLVPRILLPPPVTTDEKSEVAVVASIDGLELQLEVASDDVVLSRLCSGIDGIVSFALSAMFLNSITHFT